MTLPDDITTAAQQWLAKDPDSVTRSQLARLIEEKDEAALKQAFGGRLAFGTAGLRGVMGIGPNNMNRLLIREATAGLGNYLLETRPACAEQSVVIAYDGRHGSKEFAADAAGVLAALGLSVRLYNCRAPTPLGAFAVKKLGTAAGVVVTASHNPPEFNGYKVYQAGGTQINAPVDAQIAAHIAKVAAAPSAPECLPLEQALASGLVNYLDTDMFDTYVEEVVSYLSPGAPSAEVTSQRAALKVAYTPMHGVGAPLAEAIFRRAGFNSFWTVAEQREPDGDFPTVKFPNPEEDGAMDLVHALADKHGAHIAIANDPDADRLSVSARTKSGEIKQMSGDHIGTILGDELLRRCQGSKSKTWSLSTIVSSRILARLAEADGSNHRETLTGFKWLGAVAKQLQDQGQTFAFAYEEALGYMVTSLVWDKDGLSALLLLSLLASDLHARGETLWTRLEEIHRRVGVSVTFPRTIRLTPGTSGSSIMKSLRANLPRDMAGQPVALIDDLLDRPANPTGDEIPKNDVVRFYIGAAEGLSKRQIELSLPRIIIRPSGTEPKVKIYCESRIEVLKAGESYEGKLESLRGELSQIADAFEALATGKTPPAPAAGGAQEVQPPILKALNDKATSTLIKQGAEAKVYKATLTPEPAILTVPTSSSSSSSSSTSSVSTSRLPASPPILLKYRFPKTYRHPHLSQSITTSRTTGEVRAIVRCMKHRVNVPEVVLVDEKVGVLGLEWIDGQSVRELLGGGAEADEVGEEETEEQEGAAEVPEVVMTPEEQLKLMPLIGRQLANMHSADVIHGDLTTSNMMVRAVKRPSSAQSPSLEASFDSLRLEGAGADKEVEVVLIDFGLSFNSTTAEDKAVDLYVLERAFNSTHPNSQHLFAAVLAAYGQRVDELWRLGKWSAGSGKAGSGGGGGGGAKNPNKAARAKAQAEAQGKTRPGFAPGVGPWKEIQRKLEDVRMRGRKRSMVG